MSKFFKEKVSIVYDLEKIKSHINDYLSKNKVGSHSFECVQIDKWDTDYADEAHLCLVLEYSDFDERDTDNRKVFGNIPHCEKFSKFLSELTKELKTPVCLPWI